MKTYLVDFVGGPCSGVRQISHILHFWYLRSGELWYYYRLDEKLGKVKSEEEVAETQKIKTTKKYNPFSRAKNRHGKREYLPIQARYVYVQHAKQAVDESDCDVQTFKAWHLREHGIEIA